MLGVSRASFYRWRQPKQPSPRAVRHQQLIDVVVCEYEDARGMAERRQVTQILRNQGVRVSETTVGSILRARGLQAIGTRAWKQALTQDPQARTQHIDNHMLDDDGHRHFSSSIPGTPVVGDITYLKALGFQWSLQHPEHKGVCDGRTATAIDLCTGMVIGWVTVDHMRTELCIGVLAIVRDHKYFRSDKVVHHAGRGAQFTSAQFQAWYADNGVTQSMGRTGVRRDCQTVHTRFRKNRVDLAEAL